MDASIIIPNYNGKGLLEKNFLSVWKAFKKRKNKIRELIVVDNGSKDESVSYLKNNYPQVKIIRHKINRGFSAAINTGARMAKAPLLVLINNDVKPSENFLESISSSFNDKNVFAVSFHERGYGPAKGKFEEGFIVHEPGKECDELCKTFWVNGGSGAFRRDYWLELGGMDEKLFSPFYWEDIDLSYRAAKRGWTLFWDPKANVIHEHEATAVKFPKKYRQRIQERNQLIFIWKNLTSPILFRKHLVGLFKRISKHPNYSIIVLMAILKLPMIVKGRRREKKESKVSDEAIFAKF